jgi:hypothetical protein
LRRRLSISSLRSDAKWRRLPTPAAVRRPEVRARLRRFRSRNRRHPDRARVRQHGVEVPSTPPRPKPPPRYRAISPIDLIPHRRRDTVRVSHDLRLVVKCRAPRKTIHAAGESDFENKACDRSPGRHGRGGGLRRRRRHCNRARRGRFLVESRPDHRIGRHICALGCGPRGYGRDGLVPRPPGPPSERRRVIRVDDGRVHVSLTDAVLLAVPLRPWAGEITQRARVAICGGRSPVAGVCRLHVAARAGITPRLSPRVVPGRAGHPQSDRGRRSGDPRRAARQTRISGGGRTPGPSRASGAEHRASGDGHDPAGRCVLLRQPQKYDAQFGPIGGRRARIHQGVRAVPVDSPFARVHVHRAISERSRDGLQPDRIARRPHYRCGRAVKSRV